MPWRLLRAGSRPHTTAPRIINRLSESPVHRIIRIACRIAIGCLLLGEAASAATSIRVEADVRESARGLQTTRLEIPVVPGPLTLRYPMWIPGNHRPSGTITSLADLHISAGGQPLAWTRDAVDMFAFHVVVPAGVSTLEVRFSLLGVRDAEAPTANRLATAQLAAVQWHRLLMYPAGAQGDSLDYDATLVVPEGWRHASALPVARASGNRIEYATVTLTELVDSPVLTGRHFRSFELGGAPVVRLHAAADSEAALAIRPETERALRRLVPEARALFGAAHYRKYDFLLSLSDQSAGYGLEHHESSDNWVGERALVDADTFRASAALLPHEYTHSWNGKYRRPAGLATGNFDQPMRAELLWIYEGLTEYLQEVLAARSGLYSASDYHDEWAWAAGEMALHRGREWRALADTARGVQTLRGQPQDWLSRRRGVDYYTEGALLWLEADVRIRTLSKGRRSLDDFCRRFLGGEHDTGPMVLPYTFEEAIAALEAVQPGAWRAFWEERVNRTRGAPPLEGLEAAGWRLAYGPRPNAVHAAYDAVSKLIDLRHSLGFSIGTEDGLLADVIPGSAADAAGMAPGAVLVAVNGRKWSKTLLDDVLAASAKASVRIELLVQNDDVFRTLALDYQGGARYPVLERVPGTRDLLAEIARPRAK
jgi:predicted metalloprotease with PDZ domain